MNNRISTICVYAGSADGVAQAYYDGARALGQAMAHRGIRLVYGAGKTGLMGAVADGVLEAGGQVTGVICENLNLPNLTHAKLTELEVVTTIHVRKARMSDLADAFIALPGGFGTFDELFETLTWSQIGLHHKPVGLLNIRSYFNPLMTMVKYAQQEGFLYAEHGQLLTAAADPETLIDQLNGFQLPANWQRWLTRSDE